MDQAAASEVNRYRSYYPRDEEPLAEADRQLPGDRFFLGIQRRLDPSQLDRGLAWEAINKRFTDGCAATRLGIRKMGWTNQSDVDDPGLVVPFGTIHGAGVFSDPTTNDEWIIVAADGKCFKLHENTTSTPVPLPAGVTLTGRVTFVQGFHQLFLFRGETLDWLEMTDLNIGFLAYPAVALKDGLIRTPNADSAVYFQNRLFLPYQRDLVFMSDILELERGMDTIDTMKINQGSSDKLVALYKFNDTTLICAKENSIYVLTNIYGTNENITGQSVLDSVTNEYGCVSPKSFVQVGNDVWFLAHNRGIMSIRQTEQNKLQGIDVPGSYDIQPIIDRINWQYASRAVAASWNNKIYFAVPLDDATKKFAALAGVLTAPLTYRFSGLIVGRDYYYEAGAKDIACYNGTQTFAPNLSGAQTYGIWFTATATEAEITVDSGTAPGSICPGYRGYNNAVLVFDAVNQKWAGYDTGDYGSAVSLAVKEWVKFHYAGDIRLGFISDDGFFNLYEDGFLDMTGDIAGTIAHHSIEDKLITRGYCGSITGTKRFREARLNVSTWWPRYTLKANTDGVRETQVLTPAPITRDRTKYHYPFDKAPYNPSNVNDDALVEGREDYSLALGAVEMKSGVDLDAHQEIGDAYRVAGRGKYLQITIAGTQGRTVIRSVEVEAYAGQRKTGLTA